MEKLERNVPLGQQLQQLAVHFVDSAPHLVEVATTSRAVGECDARSTP